MIKRKSNSKSLLLASCSVTAIAIMTSQLNVVVAQELEEIVVTATKREVSIQEVPLAITAFTGEFTRQVNMNDIKDVIVWTPGVTGNTSDSFIDGVSIRGILTNDFGNGGDPSIGFFKNNLYQGRTGVVNSSMYDMERVEVLRGPQGFLFGRNAIGGALSFHTKKPILGQNSGYAELDVGERNHYVGEGAINISSSDTFGVRIAGYYSREDGWVDNVNTLGDDKLLGHKKIAVRGSALYDSGTFSALMTLEYEDRDADGSVYRGIEDSIGFRRLNDLFGVTVGGGGRDVDQNFEFGRPEDDSQVFRLGLHIDWDLGGMTLTSTTGYTDHDYLYSEDFDGTTLAINGYLQDQTGNYFQQELRLTSDSDSDSALSWYAGVSYYRENIDTLFRERSSEATQCAYYFAPYYEPPYYNYTPAEAAYYGLIGCQYYYYNNVPYDDPLNGDLDEDNRIIGKYTGWAAYANVDYKITEKFNIELGVRYTYDKKDFSIESFTPASNLGPFWALGFTTAEPLTDTRSWDDFTPRFIARYRPNEDLTLFASVTRGYKSGGFGSFNIEPLPGDPEIAFGILDPRNIDATNAVVRPGDFEPETVWSYEIGAKGAAMGGRLRWDANIYHYRYRDLQVILTGDGGGITVDNIGRARGTGFEGSVQWLLSENLDLLFSGAYASTSIRGAQAICPGDDEDACEGKGLGYVPDFSFSARLNGHYPVGNGNVTGAVELFGRTKTQAIPISTDPAEVNPSYAEIALRFGYESDSGWAVTAYVENLTNELYYDGMFAAGGILPSAWFNPSRPRTFGVRFYMNFGE
ncbi:MAG: TonB-dependent receptor [Proteobacteria bacterium]|nr:TonB-dependent receptor [Pseudomonadota bacterium]